MDQAYGGPRNLTGHRLPGYCRPWAYLLRPGLPTSHACSGTSAAAGWASSVRDAYRPARAQAALVRWARRSGRGDLVGRYIALRSRHSAGGAVDLTLVRLSDGRRLAMGTGYDHLGPAAHTLAARGHGAPQPADPEAGDGALRLQRLLAGVVAFRASGAGRATARSHPRMHTREPAIIEG